MSQAFVKEGDEQWLHDVGPSLNSLVIYLTRENNGIRVYEIKSYVQVATGDEIHSMSNGLEYKKDKAGKWEVV